MENLIPNEDYRDLLSGFVDEQVEFLLVGAFAMAGHGFPRVTLAMDVWVNPTPANAQRVLRALAAFGAPLQGIVAADFCHDDTVLQIGVAPRRIDILTGLTALNFADCYRRALAVKVFGVSVQMLSRPDLIANKRALGRHRDLADVERLESLE